MEIFEGIKFKPDPVQVTFIAYTIKESKVINKSVVS